MSVVGPQSHLNFKWKSVVKEAFNHANLNSDDKDKKLSKAELTEQRALFAKQLSNINSLPTFIQKKKKDEIENLKKQMDALDLCVNKFGKIDKDGNGNIDQQEFKKLQSIAFNYSGAVSALA